MKGYRYYPIMAILLALMTTLLFTLTGYDGAEAFASEMSEIQTSTENKNELLATNPIQRNHRTQLKGGGTDVEYWLMRGWAVLGIWNPLASFFEDNSPDGSELLAIEKMGDDYVLTMTDEEWSQMNYAELMVFFDDGEGYIDLGRDCKYDYDGRNLYITFDNTWVALNGQIVCFFNTDYVVDEDGYWYNYGVVPILYEDEEAELVLMWDSDNPEGYVAGWRYPYTGGENQEDLFELKNGMYFDFLCNYYTFDHEYEGQYLFGSMTVDGSVTVGYQDVGDNDCLVYYALYDVFNNTYWTEPLVFSWDNEE